MQVVFKNDWFHPLGRYRKTNTPQDVPNELRDFLPATAIVVSDEMFEAVVVEPAPRPADFDGVRLASDEYAQVLKDANRAADQFDVASTAAYELADKHNVEVSDIKGTGKDGRVTRFDVQARLKTLDNQ